MGGGFLQLAAYGAQDLYLTGNPQMTYFRTIFKRYTNFSVENCRQYFHGNLNFGQRIYCQIERIGDLMSETFLVVKLPSLEPYFNSETNTKFYWTSAIGHALIQSIEVEIGGKVIDRQYGIWMNIWTELTIKFDQLVGFDQMIGKSLNQNKYYDKIGEVRLYVPLYFWFCRDIGSALPLIALQNHEVRINLNIRNVRELIVSSTNNYDCGKANLSFNDIKIEEIFLYVDYIYLDDHERKWFAQNQHEYLIEQLQMNQSILYTRGVKDDPSALTSDVNLETCPVPISETTPTQPGCAPIITEHLVQLDFNHPVIEFIWVFQNSDILAIDENGKYGGNQWFNYDIKNFCEKDSGLFDEFEEYTMNSATLYIEGKERFEERDGKYFKNVINFQRHESIPTKDIYCYSFSLKPEQLQPSGSCNYSRIDNSHFIFKINREMQNPFFTIFARNYNVLRIKKGMAGVAYSN